MVMVVAVVKAGVPPPTTSNAGTAAVAAAPGVSHSTRKFQPESAFPLEKFGGLVGIEDRHVKIT